MTETSPKHSSNPQPAQGERVVCAKCEQVAPAGTSRCPECGAHLYVNCHYCGQRNQRIEETCRHCHERLHRTRSRRWLKKLLPEHTKVKPAYILLLILAVALVYRLIVNLAEFKFPNP